MGNCVYVPKGHKRIAKPDFSPSDFFYVVFNIFRIRRNDRAVIVIVGVLKFVSLIKQSRIKNEINLFMNQPADVPVGQLGGITLGFTGNGLDS